MSTTSLYPPELSNGSTTEVRRGYLEQSRESERSRSRSRSRERDHVHDPFMQFSIPPPPPMSLAHEANPFDGEPSDINPVPEPRDAEMAPFIQDPNDPITDASFCMWDYAQSKGQALENGNFKCIAMMHAENYGKVDKHTFVRMMQKVYNEKARPFLMAEGPDGDQVRTPGPAWPAENILNYCQRGIVITATVHEETALTLVHVVKDLTDNGLFERVPGARRRTVNLKVLDALLKTVVQLTKTLKDNDSHRNTSLYGRSSV